MCARSHVFERERERVRDIEEVKHDRRHRSDTIKWKITKKFKFHLIPECKCVKIRFGLLAIDVDVIFGTKNDCSIARTKCRICVEDTFFLHMCVMKRHLKCK